MRPSTTRMRAPSDRAINRPSGARVYAVTGGRNVPVRGSARVSARGRSPATSACVPGSNASAIATPRRAEPKVAATTIKKLVLRTRPLRTSPRPLPNSYPPRSSLTPRAPAPQRDSVAARAYAETRRTGLVDATAVLGVRALLGLFPVVVRVGERLALVARPWVAGLEPVVRLVADPPGGRLVVPPPTPGVRDAVDHLEANLGCGQCSPRQAKHVAGRDPHRPPRPVGWLLAERADPKRDDLEA